jgi:hypothetical protein
MDEAFRNKIGDLEFPADLPTADPVSSCTFHAGPGYKWGYGLLLNTADIPGMRRAWSGAWAGLCNTQFWVDRPAGICASIYSNFLPFVAPRPSSCTTTSKGALRSPLTRPQRLRRYPSAVIIRPATEQDWPLIYRS